MTLSHKGGRRLLALGLGAAMVAGVGGIGAPANAASTGEIRLAAGCTGTNDTDVPIPDAGAAVSSSISIAGCGRAASSTSALALKIVHTYRGDLVVTLVAPDGSAYPLKGSSEVDSGDDLEIRGEIDLSGEAADGTWQLRVQDVYTGDTGYIDTFSLTI